MKKLLLSAVFAATVVSVSAEEFFQASLTPEIAVHSRDTTIKGITLNIWGENPQTAFALGFVNGSTGQSGGLSMSLYNYAEDYKGVHWGVVNWSSGKFTGWQHSFLNVANEFSGLQSGTVNIAKKVSGVQLGFFNYTDELHGLQLGAINIVKANPWFTEFPDKLAKGFVFVNWSF
jgi:hypothetical protein